jgi:hypothetical protein
MNTMDKLSEEYLREKAKEALRDTAAKIRYAEANGLDPVTLKPKKPADSL